MKCLFTGANGACGVNSLLTRLPPVKTIRARILLATKDRKERKRMLAADWHGFTRTWTPRGGTGTHLLKVFFYAEAQRGSAATNSNRKDHGLHGLHGENRACITLSVPIREISGQ